MDVRSPFFQNIATVLIGVMFLNPIVSTAADLAVDAAAGGNTSLGAAANGVPVVNIATPNGNGLSHNKFSDYNVGEQGLILNNATNKLQSTQLGGYILGNPNLNGRAAGVILNEVTGTNPSQLKGYTEVAGQGAHVIVANPHGITCDGCGFINTPRATLSTGAPVVENGALKRYDVDGGQIRIEGQGLNASNVDQFELITRSAQINAELHARQLAMVTGRNDVDAATLAATAKADNGTDKPQLAIDSSALGGMYAGAIRLVGTEQGVGVKLAGDMAASGGDIQIDANGKLTLARTAASGNLTANATDIELTRSTYASGNARLTTGTLDNQERLAAGGDLRLDATHIDNPGRLEAGVRSDGSANTDNPASVLDIQGGTLRNRGTVNAQGSLTTDLATLDNQSAELVASGSAQIKASSLDNRQGGQLIGRQDLTLDGQTLDNRGGTVASNKALTVTARDRLDNRQDGLILSKADGLTLDTAVLDNQSGTVQADSGELKATASTLDNRNGKLLTGQGALTVDAQDLRNQQGRLIAQNGTLTARSDTLDNTAGRLQGDSVDLTTRTRLDDSQGHITATQGNLSLTRGELLNDNGQIQAKHSLTVSADSLRNHSGSLGADTIDLTLGGLLDNSGGLVEAAQTLSLDLNDARNANGKLRALGSSGESAFRLGGRFDNDNGLVEIGNAAFRLSSTQLSNQGGTLRHVGNQGFGLNLADAGQAGGRFLTNGTLSLDVADWTNSSLLQAQRIDLKVGRFTQTATGQLVSIDDITASGTDWTNDGLIETQGKLQLALSGRYQGNGSLKSQSDMTVSAASAELGSGAQLRSGGNGDFRLGGALTSAGQLSAAGDLLLKAGSVDNRGTLGAAKALRIESDSLRNERGLVFSGADMVMRTGSLTNLLGDIYSLGSLSVARDDAGARAALLENISGTLESTGDMALSVDSLINRKERFTVSEKLLSGSIVFQCIDCKGRHFDLYYYVKEQLERTVTDDSPASSINSGGGLSFIGDSFRNQHSLVTAAGDVRIQTRDFLNEGASTESVVRNRTFRNPIDSEYRSVFFDLTSYNGGVATYNRYNSPVIHRYSYKGHDDVDQTLYSPSEQVTSRANPNFNPGAGYGVPDRILGYTLLSTTEQVTGQGAASNAVIQSGGKVSVAASGSATLGVTRENVSYAGGSKKSLDSEPGVGINGNPIYLNPQLAPDTAQKPINPLDLPSFGLPQGQNGLFRVSEVPGHRYLVETNPLFASLSRFLSSDYMLDKLGYDPDKAQRRLGDGLYEQRLVREAVVARTGQRFLAGLNSDEAVFRYLMDNAIASKESLKLVPGVGLSAEQVAALTHDIVWMQEQEVQGQRVLVPVVYLAQVGNRLAPNGSLVQGTDLTLIAGGELRNQGTLRATSSLSLQSSQGIENTGLVQGSGRVALLAQSSIRNAQGGIINGRDVSLLARDGDITNERNKGVAQYAGRVSRTDEVLDNAARVEAGRSMDLQAGRDFQNSAGVLQAGGEARIAAGRDVGFTAVAENDSAHSSAKRSSWSESRTTQHGGLVAAGGALDVSAGRDIAVIASTVATDGNLLMQAGRNMALESAANESHSASQSKKVKSSTDQIRQQSTVLQAKGGVTLEAGQDMSIVASHVKGGGDVALDAGQDLSVLSAKDEDASFYFKKSKGSFGRKKTEQRESYDSTNIASVVEAGGDLTLNTSKAADGSLNINGGRDVTVIGSQLQAGKDLLIGGAGDVAVLSGVEEHGSYSKKTKSGFLGLSKSGKSQLKTSATQVASELEAGNDVVVAAGNDIRLRASETSAGNDVELRAGLVKESGGINLVSANDTAYSLTKEQQKKVGLSTSGGFLSIASAKEAGREAQSSTAVGSQVTADRDATLKARQDITVAGSGVAAGRNVLLDAGRDVNVLAAQNSSSERDWEKKKQVGIGISGDDNGVNLFIGAERTMEKNRLAQQTVAASQIRAGNDLDINAGRDINQVGSDLSASHNITLKAGHDINIDVARETRVVEHAEVREREGLGISLNHNFGSTKDAASNAGKGENGVSQGSSALRGIDAVSQFLGGPTADVKLGNSKQGSSREITEQTPRASTLEAGNDLAMTAGNDVTVKGGQLGSGRDINIKGRDVTLDVAKGEFSEENQMRQSWGGIHGGTSGGFKVGIGGSYGTGNEDQSQGTSSAAQLNAGRDVSLTASNDLTLVGTQVKADRDINLNAGNDLKVLSAQNASNSESNRHSGGGEVGLTFGSQGVGVYVSVNMGKGNLEREAERQQEAYLYAGNSLNFNSGKDTTISGATLRGDEVVGRVGGDLQVSSAVDTGKVKGKEFDLSATATFGPGAGFSGSVGYGKTTGKTDWVGEQTSITAKDKVDIRTENHTQIDGALIASDSGNLKLDTNTLGHSDIAGVDKEHGYYLNVGGSYGIGGNNAGTTQDASQVGKGKEGETGWSVNGWEYEKDRQQIVRATVGEGQIIVRNDAKTGTDSTAGLNRDVSKAYEITKDHEERTDLYVTKSSVEAVGSPLKTLEQWKQDALNYDERTIESIEKSVELVNGAGRVAQEVWRKITEQPVRIESVPSEIREKLGDATALAIAQNFKRAGLEDQLGKLNETDLILLGYTDEIVRKSLNSLAVCEGYGYSGCANDQGVKPLLVIVDGVNDPGAKLLVRSYKLQKYISSLTPEHADLVMLAAQAVMGPAKAAVGLAGNVLVASMFGSQIEAFKEQLSIGVADPLLDETAEELRLSHEKGKADYLAGKSSDNGDSYVIGAGFLLDLVVGSFGGVASKVVGSRKISTNETKVASNAGDKSSSKSEPQKGPCCFAAGTMVATPEGDKAIEALRVGDVVWTKPEKGGQPFAAAVTATHVRTDQAIYRLRLKSIDGDLRDTLLVTDSHPFYVPARNDFIPLIDLRVGDQLQSLGDGASNSATISVESIDLVQSQGVTYNLTVDIGHTFYVGNLKTWVHNSGPCEEPACKGGSCAASADGALIKELASLKAPNTRHYADKVTQGSLVKDKNTVVDRSVVDLNADVAAIRAGQARKVGENFIINDRVYGAHDGTLYPISGPGLYLLDRGGYKALGVLNKFGNSPRADEILKSMKIDDQARAEALKVWRAINND